MAQLMRSLIILLLASSMVTISHTPCLTACDAFATTPLSILRHHSSNSASFNTAPTASSTVRRSKHYVPSTTQFDHAIIAKRISPYLKHQRRSVANIQTMGLFGLGTAEIIVIVVAGAFLIGPDQVGNLAGKLAGRVRGEVDGLPDELKKIPEEFQKGVEEGEANARARNAKPMEKPGQQKDGNGR